MTPKQFTLVGAKGILAGMGLESIQMDLESIIPDDAISVCIKGDNGTGKSTILNLGLVPWREPPQIGDVYDAFGPVGKRVLYWEHDGAEYRSVIDYKQTPKTKNTKAFLHVKVDEQWSPVKTLDQTVSDGKASTYDKCLESILGDKDIYYLSAFRAQGAPKLAEYKDAKSLMRGLLNLDALEAKREKAREVIRELNRRRDDLRVKYSQAQEKQDAASEAQVKIEKLTELAPALSSRIEDATNEAAVARAELAKAMEGAIDHERIANERRAAQARLDDAYSEYKKRAQQIEKDRDSAQARVVSMKQTLADKKTDFKQTIDVIKGRIEKADTLLARRDEIIAAADKVQAIEESLENEEQTEASLSAKQESLKEIAEKVTLMEARVENAESVEGQLKLRHEELTIQAGFVAKVPCKGAGEYGSCPALVSAKQAAEEVPLIGTQIDEAKNATKKLRENAQVLRSQCSDLSVTTVQLMEIRAKIGTLKTKLNEQRKVAEEKASIARAEEYREECIADIVKLHADLEKQEADLAEKIGQAEVEAASIAARLSAHIEEREQHTRKLSEELAAIPQSDASDVVAKAKAKVSVKQALLDEEVKLSAINQATLAQLNAEVAAARKELDEQARIMELGKNLSNEIATFEVIAAAMRGIVDLSIEDAGPSIAVLANDLLDKAYGPRFTVKIVTQKEQANGKMVEAFDLRVIDSESGFEASLLQKSGGEAVWIDKAVTDAVGIFHQDAAGMHYGTLFGDEVEDGLTQARKAMFYQMDREALRIGGFRRKFIVSHNPDAWTMADHVIDLDERVKQ